MLEVGTGAAKTGATCSVSWLQVALTLVSLNKGSLLLLQLARSTSSLHRAPWGSTGPRYPGEADLSSLGVKTAFPQSFLVEFLIVESGHKCRNWLHLVQSAASWDGLLDLQVQQQQALQVTVVRMRACAPALRTKE